MAKSLLILLLQDGMTSIIQSDLNITINLYNIGSIFSSVQFSHSVMSWLFATPWTAARQASLSITNSRSPPKPMSIESVMPSNHLILCHPLLLLLSICPSIRVFSNESALHIRWSKYWSFSFNISSSNEHPKLISFRMDWLDLLEVQVTLKNLLQHHSSKASILLCSAFFIVKFSHPYMTTGKTIALTRQTFLDKVMSLLFNMLSRLVITFLPRSKCILIWWLQSPSAVILEPRKIKSATVSTVSTSVLPMNIQDWSPLGWTAWISFQSKGLSRVFSNTTVQKHQCFGAQLSWWSNSHPFMTTGKTIALTRRTFVGKAMSLLFNMLSRLVIAFLPRRSLESSSKMLSSNIF